MRLIAVLAARNEIRYLPGWFRAVLPHVDGVVVLDDGSIDGSCDLLEQRSGVLEVLRRPVSRPRWDEVANHRDLVSAALRHGAEWILAIDADERPERHFRDRAERVIRRGTALGIEAFGVRLLELWGSASTYRVDGVWGRKVVARLFQARADHLFDDRRLHAHKAPEQAKWWWGFPLADLRLYHLRMIHRADREARRRRYEELDPENRFQPDIGYAYLTDERGLKLRNIRYRRDFIGAD